ncbi:MAG: NFACT family protein [Candidatus Eisenbacteria sp.]|nr:NFACT family protein [Candidatus Eisenbacteria bacterium]
MDAFLLRALLAELADLEGSSVRSVDLADPRTLQLEIRKERSSKYLALSCDPDFPRVEILAQPDPAVEMGPFLNTARACLLGSVLGEIRQLGFDRIMTLGFTRRRPFGSPERFTLMLRLFGRGANLYLETDDGTLASLKPGPIPGNRSRQIAGGEKASVRVDPLTTSPETIRDLFLVHGDLDLQSALVQGSTGISPFWAKEILFRADLEPSTPVGALKPRQVDLLASHLSAWVAEVTGGVFTPCVYYARAIPPARPVAVSPIPVMHLGDMTCREFERVSEAVTAFYRAVIPGARDEMLRNRFRKRVREGLRRVNRSLERVAERRRTSSREAEFRRFGELIISNLHSLKTGSSELTVIDHYDPSRPHIRIPADPAKSPRVNAEKYFAKARKAQRSKKALATEIRRLTQRKEQLEREMDVIAGMETDALLARARDSGLLPSTKGETRSPKEHPTLFRTFTTSTGWTVWVGRNDRQNDLLTHSHAASHDYWFHARGMAGSHVVLRRPDKRQRPSPKTIQEAAEIAAYYSRGRNSKTVDVSYTEKKYVRKPRKGRPGLALVTNEEVIFVKPRLPETATGREDDAGTR